MGRREEKSTIKTAKITTMYKTHERTRLKTQSNPKVILQPSLNPKQVVFVEDKLFTKSKP